MKYSAYAAGLAAALLGTTALAQDNGSISLRGLIEEYGLRHDDGRLVREDGQIQLDMIGAKENGRLQRASISLSGSAVVGIEQRMRNSADGSVTARGVSDAGCYVNAVFGIRRPASLPPTTDALAAAIAYTPSDFFAFTVSPGEAEECEETSSFIDDFKIDFRWEGETDNGLTFGARIDLDDLDEDEITQNDVGDLDDLSAFLSGAFGTLTLGDTDGALDRAIDGISSSGIDDDADFYVSDGEGGTPEPEILRYDYTFADVRAGLSSISDIDVQRNAAEVIKNSLDTGATYGVSAGVRFSFGDRSPVGGAADASADRYFFEVSASYDYSFADIENMSSSNIGALTEVAGDFDLHRFGANVAVGTSFGDFGGFEPEGYVGIGVGYSVAEFSGLTSTQSGALPTEDAESVTGRVFGGVNIRIDAVADQTSAVSYDAFGIWATYDFGGGFDTSTAVGANDVDISAASFGFGYRLGF